MVTICSINSIYVYTYRAYTYHKDTTLHNLSGLGVLIWLRVTNDSHHTSVAPYSPNMHHFLVQTKIEHIQDVSDDIAFHYYQAQSAAEILVTSMQHSLIWKRYLS